MRRLIILVGLLLIPVLVQAEKRNDYDFWRSSRIDSNSSSRVLFSTIPIYAYSVVIESPTVDQGGNNYFVIATTVSGGALNLSTETFVPTDSCPNMQLAPGTEVMVEKFISTTSYIFKHGYGKIRLKWDYLWAPPPGLIHY